MQLAPAASDTFKKKKIQLARANVSASTLQQPKPRRR